MSTDGYDETKGQIFTSLDVALHTLLAAAPHDAENVTLMQKSDGSLILFAEHGKNTIEVPLSGWLFKAARRVVGLVCPHETSESQDGVARIWKLKGNPKSTNPGFQSVPGAPRATTRSMHDQVQVTRRRGIEHVFGSGARLQ
jgi:hypothetical protein